MNENVKKEANVTNSTPATKRPVAQGKDTNGMKALIMVTSLAVTLGGWGLLAASQVSNALAASNTTQPAMSTGSATTQSSQLRSVTIPQASSRPVARTRSSR